jgi:hypothetical protein
MAAQFAVARKEYGSHGRAGIGMSAVPEKPCRSINGEIGGVMSMMGTVA